MKKREFMKLCRTCCGKKKTVMDGDKIRQIPKSTRKEMAKFLLSKRYPIVREILDGFDTEEIRSLESCGYMHWYKTSSFYLLCHSEWEIALRVEI